MAYKQEENIQMAYKHRIFFFYLPSLREKKETIKPYFLKKSIFNVKFSEIKVKWFIFLKDGN